MNSSESSPDRKNVRSSLNKFYVLVFFLCLDLGLNSTLDYDGYSQGKKGFIILALLGLQIVIQISVFLILFLTVADTFLFRVGLLGILIRKIRVLLFFQILYFAITIAAGTARINHYNGNGDLMDITTSNTFTTLSIIQKLVALVYYSANLSTVMKLVDPIFFNKDAWLDVIRETVGKNAA